ncbi:hypothetical protein A1Q1_01920 [Trichosporon asahii var. asahii CBS 2479]|uniref:E2 ubiquitin-conjugating enzyme n=1 Tax=Trichosporon asahii var. asahii (strain ATCC 90039 / CBS 2479 / JCM 2466 / KCTC 7840 / NBRC 103889/ NCYC 2677 / UAMH 7654) TaxID=1186058 RepID=J6EWN4_TRIAS|nr:hypothetical protein A1Q1_01920 [Trichosporon asahii var. asahii CBS 2479]EJT49009.1 hypothetical protein A1Q1_01920 [Trichosporon asahii var. asahii CBS 2479]
MSLTPTALRLLSREIVTLRKEPPEGVRIVVDEDDLSELEGWVQGPAGTPYEGGYFRIRFDFGPEYPNLPPKCTMMTKIFHPNVSKSGEICVDTLKKAWKREYGVGHVLVTIKCLLIYPNPESALDEEAGKQLLADYEGYCKYAKLLTGIHATSKLPPAPFRDAKARPTSTLLPSPPAHTPATASPSPQPPSPHKQQQAQLDAPRPAPLGTYARQETSPAPPSVPEIKKTVPAKKPPAAKAKRGLKRL